jgi:hypothetical protein
MSQPPLPPLPWALSTYASPALTMLDSSPGLPHALVVLPGLTDTLGSLPYTDALVRALHPLGVAVVLPQLSSGLGGWGVASVEADAREAAAAVAALRARGRRAVFLLGHSTGCQDIMAFLSAPRAPECAVQGAVLQAPCSDRLDWEEGSDDEAAQAQLEEATRLVRAGQGSTLLPRAVAAPRPAHAVGRTGSEPMGANGANITDPPTTAYRYWSLYAPGGDDDYFSGDLPESSQRAIWQRALEGLRRQWNDEAEVPGRPELLALCGDEE